MFVNRYLPYTSVDFAYIISSLEPETTLFLEIWKIVFFLSLTCDEKCTITNRLIKYFIN